MTLAWIDTRPQWDDTGIIAFGVLLVAAFGSLAGVTPWLSALLIAGPILVAELSGGPGVLLAIPFALAGAHAGAFVRRKIVGH